MIYITELQVLLGLDALPPDSRLLLEALVAIAAMLYALAVRRRRTGLRAWPVAMVGIGLVVDLVVPLIGRNKFAFAVDSAAVILFMCGVARIALELVDSVRHRRREHFSTIFNDLVTLTLWALVVMVVLSTFYKINLTTLLAIPAVLTAVIGFALQETLGNIFSGLSLQLSAPFQPGDWVRSGEKVGRVQGVGWRATTIVTRSNERVEIPNAQLAKDVLFNYATHAVADEISVGVSYDEPPNRVREVVLGVLRDLPDVVHHPAPEIFAWEYGDSAIRYRIKYWLADYGLADEVRDRIVASLWYALRRDGMEIPFPIRSLRVSREHRADKSQSMRQIAQELQAVDFLHELDEEEMRILSAAVQVRHFGAGEVVVREGDPGDAFFIIRRGVVEVTAKGADGRQVHLDELTSPAFFGEMALMTGEPRNATIRARTDVQVLKMTREALTELFRAHPEAAVQMSEIIAARMSHHREVLETDAAVDGGTRGRSGWLLKKMRAIFDV
jgi:small-conductance mechanosensitive channel/CRP-like cAMP-binding protein